VFLGTGKKSMDLGLAGIRVRIEIGIEGRKEPEGW
jgi:hypothetical protein